HSKSSTQLQSTQNMHKCKVKTQTPLSTLLPDTNKTAVTKRKQRENGSMVAYLIMMLILASAIGSVGAFVVQSVNVAHRRNDMISARQYAQGGVAISCGDLNAAFLNRAGGGFPNNLGTFSYAVVSSNSTQTVY